MNILFLTFAYLPSTGGVQRSVRNLSIEFSRRGHGITIVSDGPWSGAAKLGLQRGEAADVLMLKIPDAFCWNFRHTVRQRLRDGWNLLRLVALCRARKIDVAHCQFINVDTRYAVVLKRLLRIPLVITLRGDELSHWIYNKPHRLGYVRLMLRSADAITALSQGQMDVAVKLEPALSARRVVIPNPALLETTRAAVDESAKLPASPYLVYVGRLVEFKSIDTLIAAYHGVIAKEPGFPLDLVLVGDGELEAPLRAQAASGAGSERIHFWGGRSWGESLRLTQAAEMLVLPSNDSEGCPNVLLEAMMLGTAVVVSDNDRLLEMVTPGRNGEVFVCSDPASLQRCLERLAEDEALRARYVAQGYEYLERRHHVGRIASAYEDLYASLRITEPR